MKLHNYFLVSVIIVAGVLTSCKKGDAGPQGEAGEPGTANVIYSPWFTPASYKKDTLFGSWGFSYTKAATAITQQVLDSGTVLTFGKLLGYNPAIWPTGQISQLPISITFNSGGLMTDTWSAFASPGNLKIRMVNDHNYWTVIANAHQFRYIIVPGGEATGRGRALSYEEICEKYKIPE